MPTADDRSSHQLITLGRRGCKTVSTPAPGAAGGRISEETRLAQVKLDDDDDDDSYHV